MSAPPDRHEELLDLLAAHATEGLQATERQRLGELSAEEGQPHDYYELAAAAIDLAVESETESLPAGLAERLAGTAREVLGVAESTPTPPSESRVVSFRREERPTEPTAERRGVDWARWSGWIAAAALAGFSLGLGFLTPDAPPKTDPVDPPPVVAKTLEQQRSELIAAASDLRRVAWASTEHALGADVRGEVVWSDERQEGFMTFRGLAWNDPTQRQYQLWVFDANRSAERPVDGGVFDVPATSDEVTIPIDTKLRVDEATLFAITLERPGGVVVSSREDLLLVAPVA